MILCISLYLNFVPVPAHPYGECDYCPWSLYYIENKYCQWYVLYEDLDFPAWWERTVLWVTRLGYKEVFVTSDTLLYLEKEIFSGRVNYFYLSIFCIDINKRMIDPLRPVGDTTIFNQSRLNKKDFKDYLNILSNLPMLFTLIPILVPAVDKFTVQILPNIGTDCTF